MQGVQIRPVRPEWQHYDWGKIGKIGREPCRGCGQHHHGGGMLMSDVGTVACVHCGYSYPITTKLARPATKLRLPASRRRLQTRPTSSPRPRAPRARVVVAAGRDGGQERDDGSGSSGDGDGGGDGGGGEPPSPAWREGPSGESLLRAAVGIFGSEEKLAGIIGFSPHALNRSLKTGSITRRMASAILALLAGRRP